MRRIPSLPFTVGPRARKALRIVGYIVFALVTFLFALQLTFPYERVKDRVLLELGKKYDVTIGGVSRGLVPGRMTFENLILKSRPAPKDLEKAEAIEDEQERNKALAGLVTAFYVERLEIDLGLFALITGKASLDIEADIGAGTIAGNITLGKTGTVVDLVGEDLAGERLPMRELLGLPISGNLNFAFALDLPYRKNKANKVSASWKHAEGDISFACPAGCVVGDGKTKLKMKVKKQSQEAFQGDGVKFGKVNIDSLAARVKIGKGILEVTKFQTASADGELHVDYQMVLEDNIDDSTVTGCLRFAGSEVLRQREPDTHSAFLATGALRGPDNLFHIKLGGTYKKMSRLPQSCGPGIGASPNDGKDSETPQLTIQPTEEPKPPVGDSGTPGSSGSAEISGAPPVNPPPPAAALSDAGAPPEVLPGNLSAAQPGVDGDPSAPGGSGSGAGAGSGAGSGTGADTGADGDPNDGDGSSVPPADFPAGRID